jgi:hypothetical protein
MLSKLEFSTSLIKLISSFLSQRKFSVSVEGEMSTSREIRVGEPQGSVLSPTLYDMHINDAPQTPGVCVVISAMALVCTRQIERRFLSEISNVVSAQWRPGVSAGILK